MNTNDRTHLPGLDALRALAVGAVVVFHLGGGWLPGGYLGVSLFFTLSGFLITRNLLLEHERNGGISLRAFWGRRARRLLPAAWVTLAVVTVVSVVRPWLGREMGFAPGDVIASLCNVANWWFLASDTSYAALFRSPSPVLHFWSLAIEEQAYLLMPLVVIACLRGRGGARRVAWVAALAALVSFSLPFVRTMSVDRVYYGTDTRLGEILVGIVLAAWLHHRPQRAGRPLVTVAGMVGLVVFAGACLQVGEGARRIASGLLPFIAATSCVLVWSALHHDGFISAIGRNRVVAWVGAASYGIYLVHWPIIVALRSQGVDTGTVAVAVVVIAVVAAIAWASLRWLEMPVRQRRWPRVTVVNGGIVTASLIVSLCVFAAPEPTAADDLLASLESGASVLAARHGTATADASGSADTDTGASVPVDSTSEPAPSDDSVPAGATPSTAPVASPAPADATPAMRFFGDSILLSLVLALPVPTPGGPPVPDVVPIATDQHLGCGFAAFDEPASGGPIVTCADPGPAWAESFAAQPVDAAVLMSCQWEAVDRLLPDGRRAAAGDPGFDRYVADEYRSLVDDLSAAGAPVVLWVRCPHFSRAVGTDGDDPRLVASRDPARVDALNAVAGQVVADARADGLAVCEVDITDWVEARLDDATVRPDGSHFEWRVDTGVGGEFADRLMAAWRSCRAG